LELFTAQPADLNEEGAFRMKLGIPEDKSLVCFVGRIGHEKNIDTLLHYWRKSAAGQRFHLLVIGDGPARVPLVSLAESLGVADSVSFIGRVEHEILPFYYKICKAYITASLTEAYSIAMLEAMATGLPVLQLCDELNREQIQEGVNGFIFESPEEMGVKLCSIADMPNDAYAVLRDSVAHSAFESSPINVTGHILEIYNSISTQNTKPGKHARRRAARARLKSMKKRTVTNAHTVAKFQNNRQKRN
jgi:1,2-diacylglycerol 3-alpha-glucosyltransferase